VGKPGGDARLFLLAGMYSFWYIGRMKLIQWLGSSRTDVRAFPEDARIGAGWQLELVQRGLDPDDWKPMPTIGSGVREIRIREASGAFRILYLATLEDRVLVLHAFQKKTQATPKKDIELAIQRLKRWKQDQ
jgi:phage-related protein